MRRYNIRPGAGMKKWGRIASVPFTIIAVFFVYMGVTRVIPSGAGAFGIVWTVIACCFVGVGLYGIFSKNGLTGFYGLTVEREDDAPPAQGQSASARLEELEDLYRRGLVNREEYDEKRQKILEEL